MKIGIFDSGLGGLFVLRSMLRSKLPKYNYIYLGDTKNLPYGDKGQKQIFDLTKQAVNYLFGHDCQLILIACNTSSSQALRKIQQEYLPKSKFKDRRVLGIIRPTVESIGIKTGRVGIIGTNRTIDSKAYLREFEKYNPKLKIYQQKTPLLVPMIENNKLGQLNSVLRRYLRPLINKRIDALILGCTHYAIIKKPIRNLLPKNVKIISQELILPSKLKSYLKRHKEIDDKLTRNGKLNLLVTKDNPVYDKHAKAWFGKSAKLELVKY